jgi:ketosteroid isomerase-like protein
VSGAASLEAVVRRYYDGCNAGDGALMRACLTVDAVHYFPDGAPQGPFRGASAIAEGWIDAVRRLGSRWSIDRIAVDEPRQVATVEWTHWKVSTSEVLRGAELLEFREGRISEIRAYYACPPARATGLVAGLGGFDYAGKGFSTEPPDVARDAAIAAERA